jgi:hypothetical protein
VARLELHYELVPEKLADLGLLRDGGEPLVQQVLQIVVICSDDEWLSPKV